jgi:hypothetical protein
MANHEFRYIEQEPLISGENLERLVKILALPIDLGSELTEDELSEAEDISLAE